MALDAQRSTWESSSAPPALNRSWPPSLLRWWVPQLTSGLPEQQSKACTARRAVLSAHSPISKPHQQAPSAGGGKSHALKNPNVYRLMASCYTLNPKTKTLNPKP
eukprot:358413-Chlamydomonas_euryale.AAC.8